MKSLANEFFRTMEDGAKAHNKANAAKYTLVSNGIKNETDTVTQIRMVEQMIAQKANAIVVSVDSQGAGAGAQDRHRQGHPGRQH